MDKPVYNQGLNWQDQPERGGFWGLQAMAFCLRWFGPRVCLFACLPAVGFFYLSDPVKRQALQEFLAQRNQHYPQAPSPAGSAFWNYVSFAQAVIDRAYFWVKGSTCGYRFEWDGKELLEERLASGQGAFLVSGHMGNVELLRAAGHDLDLEVSVLMYLKHAQNYN